MKLELTILDSSWNVMAHGDARDGKWRENWQMEWVVSTLHTTSEHGVSSITTPDAHTSAAGNRLNWRPPPADLNGLVRFAERRNLVSTRVPSHFNWPLLTLNSLRHGNYTEWLKVLTVKLQSFYDVSKCTNLNSEHTFKVQWRWTWRTVRTQWSGLTCVSQRNHNKNFTDVYMF